MILPLMKMMTMPKSMMSVTMIDSSFVLVFVFVVDGRLWLIEKLMVYAMLMVVAHVIGRVLHFGSGKYRNSFS